jgi:hypothetical protein
MKLKISDVEAKLGKRLKKNFRSIGCDIATHTGVGFAMTDDEYLHLDWTLLNFTSDDKRQLFEQLYTNFNQLITNEDIVIIEDVFIRNQAVGILLARMGAFVLANCIIKKIPYELISAVSSRSRVGINTKLIPKGQSKEYVANWLKEMFGLELDEDNVADGILLAICGLIEGCEFKKLKSKKKRKK